MIVLSYLLTVMVGALLGYFAAVLCFMASHSDKQMESEHDEWTDTHPPVIDNTPGDTQ